MAVPAKQKQLQEELAQKEADIEGLRQQVKQLREERDEWRATRVNDDEAQAISDCVRALNTYNERVSQRQRFGSSYVVYSATTSGAVYQGPVERILRYLASRYGINLNPPQVELTEQV